MFGFPGHIELLVVGLIVLLLFGKRLPGVMRSLGSSLVEFKRGLRDNGEESDGENPLSDPA